MLLFRPILETRFFPSQFVSNWLNWKSFCFTWQKFCNLNWNILPQFLISVTLNYTFIYFIRNLASLFFAFFFLFYFISKSSRCKNPQVRMMKKLKLLRCPKTKRSRYGLRIKKWKFPRFRFCPIPNIENSEISETCLFFQILTVVVTQDLKATKIWTERKTKRFRFELKEKIKISEFPILTYTQDKKLENLGNFVYLEFWHWLLLKI